MKPDRLPSTEFLDANPLNVAHLHITQTRHLLETLITSSESFDYVKAKAALKELQKKQRELLKLEAKFSARKAEPPNVRVVDFRSSFKEQSQ